MDWIKDFDLFLFDFDGLLVNTEHIHYQAYTNMLRDRGHNLDWSFDKYLQIAHSSSDGLKIAILSEFPDLLEQGALWTDLYNEKKKHYLKLLLSSKVELMKGVEKLLLELQKENKKRVVVTHSPKEQVDLIKANNPILKIISYWITREDYLNPKPAPDGYLRAIELYGEKEDKIIGFEDSYRGLKSLLDTPAKAILICHAHHPQLESLVPSDVNHFESFDEINFF